MSSIDHRDPSPPMRPAPSSGALERMQEALVARFGGDPLPVESLVATRGCGSTQKLSTAPDPTHFGRYQVLHRLGSGAMGVVYAAHDPRLNRRVAIKALSQLRPSESSRARVYREAQALAQLSHANVVQVFEIGRDNDIVFVAMEYIDGETLAQWQQARRGWREVRDVYLQAACGLGEIHRAGLVHRDFKPANVMRDTTGQVRVLDLGLVRGEESCSESGEASSPESSTLRETTRLGALESPLTETHALLGTPAYMAPEQFLGNTASAASDQFSFCVALFEALHHHRPFSGSTAVEVLESITEGQIQAPSHHDKVPAWLDAVVMRGLSAHPDKRFVSMQALSQALAGPWRGRWVGLGVLVAATILGAALMAPIVDQGLETVHPPTAQVIRGHANVWLTQAAKGNEYAKRGQLTKARKELESAYHGLVPLQRDRKAAGVALAIVWIALAERDRESAMQWLRNARSRIEAGEVSDPETLGRLKHREALVATAGGAHKEAATAFGEAAALFVEAGDPVEEATALLGLAGVQNAMGELGKAVATVTRAIEINAETFGPVHRQVATAYSNLGNFRQQQGKYELALQAHERGLEIRKQVFGPDNLQTGISAYAVATDLFDLRRFDEADSSLAYARRSLPEDHPAKFAADGLSASLAIERQDYATALRLQLAALVSLEAALGADSPHVAITLIDTATTYRRMGDPAKAIETAQIGLTRLRHRFGDDHNLVATGMQVLGRCLHAAGRSEEAAVELRAAIAYFDKTLEDPNPRTWQPGLVLAAIASKAGQCTEARALLERVPKDAAGEATQSVEGRRAEIETIQERCPD